MIAADGARGKTREQLGIDVDGVSVYGHFLNINFEVDLKEATKVLCLIYY